MSIDKPKVHALVSDSAYDATQCDATIEDGDVLVVADCGIVGFLFKAWPVALVGDYQRAGFHTISWESYGSDPEHPAEAYEKSIRLACETAESDADVTGNRQWVDEVKAILDRIGR